MYVPSPVGRACLAVEAGVGVVVLRGAPGILPALPREPGARARRGPGEPWGE